jgi:hypothetical protein
MCQKTNIKKHFFVLLNHPFPLQRAVPLGVVKNTVTTQNLYEISQNTTFFSEKQIKDLGFQSPNALQSYLVPIEIPRDWFLH